ncbi:hypothetical protein MKW92_018259 [Papaver armeniacum]|nr:hypothetical protein MKW92_018259 [Papaver armeniacum]
MLLKYNPFYKKTPVLVHGGKPISESMVIRRYIDETWPKSCPLLPKDPYEKSNASVGIFFSTTGAEQEKAQNEISKMLKTIEEKGGLREKKFFGGDAIRLVDLAIAPIV